MLMSALLHALILFVIIFLIGKSKLKHQTQSSELLEVSAQSSKVPVSDFQANPPPETMKSHSLTAIDGSMGAHETSQIHDLGAENEYDLILRKKIAAQEQYPKEAQKRRLEGLIEVEFELDGEGRIEKISSISAGKPTILVEAALDAVKRASPFLPPPAGKTRKFVIPIEFKIK